MKNIFKFLSIIILLSSSVLYSKDFKNSIDKKSGLIINKGIETVKMNCTFCHSAKSIILQRATSWLSGPFHIVSHLTTILGP